MNVIWFPHMPGVSIAASEADSHRSGLGENKQAG